jgi:UDP-galactopyranose mutase
LKTISVVGAGFSGAVIARELANKGYRVIVFESRSHAAGNSHCARDPETGVMVHTFGPHIFNTSNVEVWDYVRQFDNMIPFINRVKAISNNRVYSLPINLLTINQFFSRVLSPSQAVEFINTISNSEITEPKNFEEQALRFIGRELYETFFKGYTIKQWGVTPSELPASILKRLPIRFNYDDNYYSSCFQGIPENGYTFVVEKILEHPCIELRRNTYFSREMKDDFAHVFYSGPLDAWFSHSLGKLGYRTLDFIVERHEGDYQGNAVINYCDLSVPWTRICEHKHFAPWESHQQTIIYREFSRGCGVSDIPYYPIRQFSEMMHLQKYVKEADKEKNVTFVGRLGTYRYLDMHISIEEALKTARVFIERDASGGAMPAFVVDPLA